GTHLDFGLAFDLRRRVDERERGLSPLLEIEWRDADEAMRAALGLEIAVCVWTFDGKGRASKTGLIARGGFQELRLEAPSLRPAQVHPDEHLGPIGRVGASDPRRYREDGAALVVGPRELRLEAGTGCFRGELDGVAGDVGFHLRIAVGHRSELAQIFRARAKTLPPLDTIALSAEAPQDPLRPLPVLPEVRLGGFGL